MEIAQITFFMTDSAGKDPYTRSIDSLRQFETEEMLSLSNELVVSVQVSLTGNITTGLSFVLFSL
jgi:hypothetical protein